MTVEKMHSKGLAISRCLNLFLVIESMAINFVSSKTDLG